MKTTGRTRHRLHKTIGRKTVLVLQIELQYQKTSYRGGYLDTYNAFEWRDATVEDSQHVKGDVA